MPLSDDLLDDYENDIRQLLQHSDTAQCSLHVEKFEKSQQHRTFLENREEEEPSSDADGEDTIVYAIGSLTQLLVALLISIIV
jgi:hypothetical protein